MGIEQSSYQQTGSPTAANTGQKSTGAINRTVTVRQDSADGTNGSGRSSPHPSLCSSETDVPYVSYTVNKPIGDSPKHQGRLTGKQPKGSIATSTQSKLPKGRNIVVVSQKSMSDGGEEDSEIQTLQRIPLFLPIIRSSLSTSHPREPDIVDRLDIGSLQRIISMLEDNLKLNAESIASEQQQLGQSMKEIDSQLASIMSALTDRQKQYARYAEKLSRVHEISHSLSRCQKALATALDSIETLNNQLPANERLEPFVWSTG